MTKFLCLQRSVPASATSGEGPSPAQMQEMYAKFGEWQSKYADHLVDLGGKLGDGRVVTDGPVDGPLVEIKELAGGYMIVQAETIEEAIAVASACPGLVRPGSGVEVVSIVTA